MPCPRSGQLDPVGRPRKILGDVDYEGAVIRPGDEVVDPVEFATIGQLDAFARPSGDVRIDIEQTGEVPADLAPEERRTGALDGGKRIVEARRLVSRDDIARRPLQTSNLFSRTTAFGRRLSSFRTFEARRRLDGLLLPRLRQAVESADQAGDGEVRHQAPRAKFQLGARKPDLVLSGLRTIQGGNLPEVVARNTPRQARAPSRPPLGRGSAPA